MSIFERIGKEMIEYWRGVRPQRLLASGVALFAFLIGGTAQAGGTHADVDYPTQEQIDRALEAGRERNVGGFGRLFDLRTPTNPTGLQPHPSPRYDLLRLGRAMFREDGAEQPSEMPVGYVFLGQFIDHDITLDTVTSFDEIIDHSELENARTVDLDLDCVYGGGPERSPFLYDGPYLRTGALTVRADNPHHRRFDLLRIVGPGRPTALIGDPRNDENFVIAQVQAAFVAYHNRMVDRLLDEQVDAVRRLVTEAYEAADEAPPISRAPAEVAEAEAMVNFAQISAQKRLGDALGTADGGAPTLAEVLAEVTPASVLEDLASDAAAVLAMLEEARALTIHHYHRVIAEDFLPRIIGVARVRDILENGRDFYFPGGFRDEHDRVLEPYIPIEFAVAGYRFGHSQVPGSLALRDGEAAGEVIRAALFAPDKSDASETELRPDGFTPIRTDHGSLVLDWQRFVDLIDERAPAEPKVQRARRIDTTLSSPLATLDEVGVVGPGGLGNLAARNLSRGRTYLLPSGQDLAELVLKRLHDRGVLPDIYSRANAISDVWAAEGSEDAYRAYVLPPDETTRATLGLRETPLWYYILQEAERFGFPFTGASERGGRRTMAAVGIPPAVQLYDEEVAAAAKRTRDDRGAPPRPATGATLGPVGASIVGETLLGLISHYREMTNQGLDLNVRFDYADLPYGGPVTPAGGVPPLTETVLDDVAGESFGRRYLFRNLLHDAGVVLPPAADQVCEGPETQPTTSC